MLKIVEIVFELLKDVVMIVIVLIVPACKFVVEVEGRMWLSLFILHSLDLL